MRLLLTQFQGKGLIYSISDKVTPTKFKVEKVDSLRPDVYMYVHPVTSDWHYVFIIESYIQRDAH